MSLYQIFLRSILSYFSVAIFGLGSIAMIFNSERLTLHDLCANTQVVESPNFNRKFFLVRTFYFISLLTGSLVGLAGLTVLICAPAPLLSNYLYDTNVTGYDSVAFYTPASNIEPEQRHEELRIPFSNGQVSVLINLKDSAEYLDFKLDSSSEKNYINQQTLEKLAIPQTKIARYFQAGDKPWAFTVQPYINVYKLSLRDVGSTEIDIYNQIFHLHTGENKLGRAFLDLFDYALDREASEMLLKPHDYDLALFTESLKPKSKIILSQIYRKLNADWKLKLRTRHDKVATAQKLKYDLVFDSNSGQIVEITLLEPTVDKALVAFAEQFLREYVVTTKLNNELKRIPGIKLGLTLVTSGDK